MSEDLSGWTPRALPERVAVGGAYARLEPIEPALHGDDLFEAARAGDYDARFRYLPDYAPPYRAAFEDWLTWAAASTDPLFFAVIDQVTGRATGRQSLLRITPDQGTAEIGHVHWGPAMARSRIATEALYLAARQVFDLGYRRFEWKCNAENAPSRAAALRFGFTYEGTFRNHMVVKGKNRDTAWFAMTDADWAALRPRYEAWLIATNFDADGGQITKLSAAS